MVATTKADRLARVRKLQGICYVPSWARGPQDSLGDRCQRDTMSRELEFVNGLGLNGVRLWLSIHSYEADPDRYLGNLIFFLDRCRDLGLDAHLNLFDSVGIDPEDASAPRVRKEQAFAGKSREMQLEAGFTTADATSLMPVPDCGVPVILATEYWLAGPGYRHVGPAEWPRCERFLRAIVGAVRSHPALVILEVMNEPEACLFRRQVDFAPVAAFYAAMLKLLQQAAPDVPTTIGSTRLANFKQADAETGQSMDIITFHSFNDPAALRSQFAEAKAYATATGDRPVICSEWGTYPGAADEKQLELYKQLLPVALESGAAWEIAHLLAAYCNGALAALLYSNGTMRPSGLYVRETMTRTAR